MSTQTKLIIYDDYRNLPDDGKRCEIIGGKLFMTASPVTKHERISRKLSVRFDGCIEKHSMGEVFMLPLASLSMTDAVQPDLMFIANERSRIATEKTL